MPKWFVCEVIGTFIMVFLGLGIVAASITSDATTGIFQIAAVWGLGLACAIFITAHHSGAHFNPAITLAFAFQADFPKRESPTLRTTFRSIHRCSGGIFFLKVR